MKMEAEGRRWPSAIAEGRVEAAGQALVSAARAAACQSRAS